MPDIGENGVDVISTWEEMLYRVSERARSYREALYECLPLLSTAADQGAGGDFDGMYSHVCDVLGIPDDVMQRDPDVIGVLVTAQPGGGGAGRKDEGMSSDEPGRLVEMVCVDCGKPFKVTRMARIVVTAKDAHPRCPDCKSAWNQHRTLLRQRRLRAERRQVSNGE